MNIPVEILNKWFYLDADNRRNAPNNKPYCIRCQKEIKDLNKAIPVILDSDYINVMYNEQGKHLIGADCWKQITKPCSK